MSAETDELIEKLGNLRKIGWKEMTVAELAAHLAGLPPMMEVFTDSDGVAMFLNDAEVQEREGNGGPFLRLKCSVKPKPPAAPSTESVEQQTARQAQRAMGLAHGIEAASRMPTDAIEPHINYGE
jgi:hypothetical protein